MTQRERVNAILHYQAHDHMPVVHFGYWTETLVKWSAEGHLDIELAWNWSDGNDADRDEAQDLPLGLNCGSLFGNIRNWAGLEGVSYLYAIEQITL